MLRRWQSECIGNATTHYIEGNKHFLAQATPGAGKTFMAANLAKRLFELSMIDFVICFSPSKTVSSSIQSSFSKTLQDEMDGKFGSLGISMTYQSITHLDDTFWKKLSKYRVLCVFDEIHHCGGNNELNSNAWGQHILCKIQNVATYTLALTGTPWRSDLIPITLASYSVPDGEIVCNYQYTLKQAITDKVCRRPKITLIDCEFPQISSQGHTVTYKSINELFKDSELSYSSLLNNRKANLYLLTQAINKLKTLRHINQAAGGLIVASSIKHAKALAQMLETEFGQSTITVTHQDADAQNRIKQFKENYTQWIVSVGMISEGTDIPRLQVCCHLSNIKTELYFRQVLGRILRRTTDVNQEAWLYTFSEAKLTAFSTQIELDIPESCVHLKAEPGNEPIASIVSRQSVLTEQITDAAIKLNEHTFKWEDDTTSSLSSKTETYRSRLILQQFKKKVVDAFRYS